MISKYFLTHSPQKLPPRVYLRDFVTVFGFLRDSTTMIWRWVNICESETQNDFKVQLKLSISDILFDLVATKSNYLAITKCKSHVVKSSACWVVVCRVLKFKTKLTYSCFVQSLPDSCHQSKSSIMNNVLVVQLIALSIFNIVQLKLLRNITKYMRLSKISSFRSLSHPPKKKHYMKWKIITIFKL